MNYVIKTIFCLLLVSNVIYAQNSKVIAGPMTSFIDYYGTEIWFLLDSNEQTIEIEIAGFYHPLRVLSNANQIDIKQ